MNIVTIPKRLPLFAAVMNILAKFNHDSTVKPGIVSFSGRKFMKIIDCLSSVRPCAVPVAGDSWGPGTGGNYPAAGF